MSFEEKRKLVDHIKTKSKLTVSGYFRKCQHKLFGKLFHKNHYYIIPECIEIITLIYYDGEKPKVVLKIGLLGDFQVGKTTLMNRYIEERFDEDYISTLCCNFMEKTIKLKNVDVTISIWDLGGQREFATLMPLVCDDAKAILFLFDLTHKQSLYSVKRWYKEARKENKIFYPLLVGTKYDLFRERGTDFKQDITKQSRKFAKKMRTSLIYCSSLESINIKKIFKIVLARIFNLTPKMKQHHDCNNEPIIEFGEDFIENINEKRNNKKKKKKKH